MNKELYILMLVVAVVGGSTFAILLQSAHGYEFVICNQVYYPEGTDCDNPEENMEELEEQDEKEHKEESKEWDDTNKKDKSENEDD